MRWTPGRRSRNLEDRRGHGRGRVSAGRGPVRFPLGRGKGMGLGGIVLMFGVAWLLGINPLTLLTAVMQGGGASQVGIDLGGARPGPATPGEPLRTTAEEEKLVDFVSFVLDDLQATWARLLPGYQPANLVLFRDATRSACGVGQSEMGPFYCPADGKVYVDLSFYDDLRSRFGAPGDFAQAYVLAHEIGHHIQALSGVEAKVRRSGRFGGDRGELSVRMELQADCLAGVWGHQAAKRDVLEPGDIEEGLRAAAAIGDDRIQKMSGRGVHPESFTHGSSQQRASWLERGLQSGDPDACDTFSIAQP